MDQRPLSRESVDDIEAELHRRNAALDEQSVNHIAAANEAMRLQAERLPRAGIQEEDEVLLREVLEKAQLEREGEKNEQSGMSVKKDDFSRSASARAHNSKEETGAPRASSGRRKSSAVPSDERSLDQPLTLQQPNPKRSASAANSEAQGEAPGRLIKTRVKALEEDLKEASKQLEAKDKRLTETSKELKKMAEENAALQKKNKSLALEAEKSKRSFEDTKAALQVRERELQESRKEAERKDRGVKANETDTRSREVRLNRALEEVERYKSLLEEVREQSKGGSESYKQELDTLSKENKQ
ncbi:hypothetical protein CYMTET_31561 [Cymbomonas tetramitiformis]|uniref:Uncharacterized protein n=1 Tax=Cymbomonas tetramitiformis TaxID=36881 RepID=A0AAE0KSS1_9CHLO|nr:hypothetical protein CYMTET_31561 [Cymbomonas tetramitiformis]